MLEIIKNICFFVITFYLFFILIRSTILCNKFEKKLKEVSNIEELKKLYYEN